MKMARSLGLLCSFLYCLSCPERCSRSIWEAKHTQFVRHQAQKLGWNSQRDMTWTIKLGCVVGWRNASCSLLLERYLLRENQSVDSHRKFLQQITDIPAQDLLETGLWITGYSSLKVNTNCINFWYFHKQWVRTYIFVTGFLLNKLYL